MSIYRDLQIQVFNWLKSKHETDDNFTFSVRQKANKGAELNYFIGTEKSRYFSTTFWYIPVAYPGSSGDLINLVFTVTKNNKIEFHFQFNQTKSPIDNQNRYALEFIQSIKPLFKEKFPNGYYAPDSNKMEFFAAYSKPVYDNFEELQDDLNNFLNEILPIVNQQILIYKNKYPDFIANRFSQEDQTKMFGKMEERFQRYKIIEELEDELEEEDDLIIVTPSEFKMPLNQILYGPPGTGKTYHSINKAISIANPEFDLNQERDLVKKEYQRLVDAGQIVFTTFHQSMSYEDFVEGIKPEIEEDSEGVKTVIYEIKKGIFKEISENAQTIRLQSEEVRSKYTFDDAWDDLLKEADEHINGEQFMILGIQTAGMGLNIVAITDKGNLKVQPQSSNEAREYTVSFSRAKKLQAAFPDLTVIKNIDKEFREVIGGSNSTAYWAVVKYINDKIKSKTKPITQEIPLPAVPYVLIIDEINRGNVSQIFGELITLIEEDKRLGNPEELQLTLPYSKTKFGVPSNVYIIGTMNTADRSVEALDTALRRRFFFEEMLPDLEVLTDKKIEGIALKELLGTINKRVEILLDRDHTIGHSYLMNINSEEDLKSTFRNNIIPLLQEYFYGDYEKIGLILGKGFFEDSENYTKDIFASFPTQNYPENGSVLRLKPIDETFNIIEALESLLIKAK